MINAFLLSLAQFSDRRILFLLLKIIVITGVIFVAIGMGGYWGLSALFEHLGLFEYLGWSENSWIAALTATIITVLLAIFLFRILSVLVLGIYCDEVVDAVERRHYPDFARAAQPPNWMLGLRIGLASAGRALGYNLLALPLYIGLIITGIGSFIAILLVNAVLLGRDLQEMVAMRHISPGGDDGTSADEMTVQKNGFRVKAGWNLPARDRFLLGIIVSLLFIPPVVNFFAPILGAAMATHLMHRHKSRILEAT